MMVYINLKFGQPLYPNNPTYILEMRVEALDQNENAKPLRKVWRFLFFKK